MAAAYSAIRLAALNAAQRTADRHQQRERNRQFQQRNQPGARAHQRVGQQLVVRQLLGETCRRAQLVGRGTGQQHRNGERAGNDEDRI